MRVNSTQWRALENCVIYSVTVTLRLRFTCDLKLSGPFLCVVLSFLRLSLLLFLIPAAKLSVKQRGKAGGWPIFLLYRGAQYVSVGGLLFFSILFPRPRSLSFHPGLISV